MSKKSRHFHQLKARHTGEIIVAEWANHGNKSPDMMLHMKRLQSKSVVSQDHNYAHLNFPWITRWSPTILQIEYNPSWQERPNLSETVSYFLPFLDKPGFFFFCKDFIFKHVCVCVCVYRVLCMHVTAMSEEARREHQIP